jgi:hypothetical protein
MCFPDKDINKKCLCDLCVNPLRTLWLIDFVLNSSVNNELIS